MGRNRPKNQMPRKMAEAILQEVEQLVEKTAAPRPPGLNEYEKARARRAVLELTRRSFESLRLYEPMPEQHRFHASRAKERLVYGSNRSGKTLSTVCEVVRAITNQDPFNKYPKGGVCYIVGKDQKQVAEVLWKKMARPGPFKMIRDLETGQWRSYRPCDAIDMAREADARPAPPLLPGRWIKDIAWADKKMDLPSVVTLISDWKVHFFSGEAMPTQGSVVDLALCDEELPKPLWYWELAARLVDRNGLFIWGATAQHSTEILYGLHQRAMEEATNEKPGIEEFKLLIMENKFISAENKLDFISKLSDEERRVRVDGEFAIQGSIIFPEYSKDGYSVPWFDIPQDWTRYVAIDPGRQVCAALFMAIPPPMDKQHGGFAYLYDELYIANSDPALFAERMAERARTQTWQSFLFDMQHGRKHLEIAGGATQAEIYSEELGKRNVTSVDTGSGFIAGSNNPDADVEVIRLWLRPRDGFPPKLRVLGGTCPNFHKELINWRYMKDAKGNITNRPENRGPVHLMAALRYLVQHDPKWVPAKVGKQRSRIEDIMRQRMGPRAQRPLVMLGPVGG